MVQHSPPCFGDGSIRGKCAIVAVVIPLCLPLLLPAAVADEVRLLLLPIIRSNSLTMESSPSPPPPSPPPLPARNTLSWPSKLKELKDANEHMPIDGTLPVELLRLCRGGKEEVGAAMASGDGRTSQYREECNQAVLEAKYGASDGEA